MYFVDYLFFKLTLTQGQTVYYCNKLELYFAL
jgi:hypothetical protein